MYLSTISHFCRRVDIFNRLANFRTDTYGRNIEFFLSYEKGLDLDYIPSPGMRVTVYFPYAPQLANSSLFKKQFKLTSLPFWPAKAAVGGLADA